MTIFAITTNFEFIRKPEWVDSFLMRYNKAGQDFHITLKQPCVIQEDQVTAIRILLSQYIATKQPKHISIAFDKLYVDASVDGLTAGEGCIMIESNNNDLSKLQSEIINILSSYKNYLDLQTKLYEDNFRPHITIAADLDKKGYESAAKDLEDDVLCNGRITEIQFIVMHNFDSKQKNAKREVVSYKLT